MNNGLGDIDPAEFERLVQEEMARQLEAVRRVRMTRNTEEDVERNEHEDRVQREMQRMSMAMGRKQPEVSVRRPPAQNLRQEPPVDYARNIRPRDNDFTGAYGNDNRATSFPNDYGVSSSNVARTSHVAQYGFISADEHQSMRQRELEKQRAYQRILDEQLREKQAKQREEQRNMPKEELDVPFSNNFPTYTNSPSSPSPTQGSAREDKLQEQRRVQQMLQEQIEEKKRLKELERRQEEERERMEEARLQREQQEMRRAFEEERFRAHPPPATRGPQLSVNTNVGNTAPIQPQSPLTSSVNDYLRPSRMSPLASSTNRGFAAHEMLSNRYASPSHIVRESTPRDTFVEKRYGVSSNMPREMFTENRYAMPSSTPRDTFVENRAGPSREIFTDNRYTMPSSTPRDTFVENRAGPSREIFAEKRYSMPSSTLRESYYVENRSREPLRAAPVEYLQQDDDYDEDGFGEGTLTELPSESKLVTVDKFDRTWRPPPPPSVTDYDPERSLACASRYFVYVSKPEDAVNGTTGDSEEEDDVALLNDLEQSRVRKAEAARMALQRASNDASDEESNTEHDVGILTRGVMNDLNIAIETDGKKRWSKQIAEPFSVRHNPDEEDSVAFGSSVGSEGGFLEDDPDDYDDENDNEEGDKIPMPE